MELQIGLAIVDELNGGKETAQRMGGWIGREPRHGRRLRVLGAAALVALATRLDPAGALPQRGRMQATPANQARPRRGGNHEYADEGQILVGVLMGTLAMASAVPRRAGCSRCRE